MTMNINERVFLSMIPNGGSGIYGKVTGFTNKYGMAYIVIESDSGKKYSAPIQHAREA